MLIFTFFSENLCVPGMYRNSSTGGECRPCPRGSYSDIVESNVCTPCPAGQTTRSNSSRSSDCHESKTHQLLSQVEINHDYIMKKYK